MSRATVPANKIDAKVYDAVVLGAGITGLVSANIVLKQGAKSVLVIDQYNRLGGNHINIDIAPYTFDVGSLIFQDDSPLLAHFPEILPLYQPVEQSTSRLRPDGRILDYPLSVKNEIVKAGPVEWLRIGASVIIARLFRPKPSNAETYARFWIGDRFFEQSGLKAYMRRFYGVAPALIELPFAEKRMAWVAQSASLTRVLLRMLKRTPLWPENQSLVRPKEGFQHLYAPARLALEAKGADFNLGVKLIGLKRDGEDTVVSLEGGDDIRTKRLISTIPIDLTLALFGEPPEAPLPTLNLTTLFYSFGGDRGFDRPILYNFSDEGHWKRLTMFSDFFGKVDGRDYFCAEVVSQGEGEPIELLDQSFHQHTRQFKIFNGDLKLEGAHYLEQAYPVYLEGVSRQLAAKIARLKDLKVESFGRQGGFDYQPTARNSTNVAEENLGAPISGFQDVAAAG